MRFVLMESRGCYNLSQLIIVKLTSSMVELYFFAEHSELKVMTDSENEVHAVFNWNKYLQLLAVLLAY